MAVFVLSRILGLLPAFSWCNAARTEPLSSVVTKEVANSISNTVYLLEERKKLQSKACKMDGSATCTCISLIAELLKLIFCAQWPLVHLHCLFKSLAHILIRCFIAVVTFRFDYQSLFFYIVYKYFLLFKSFHFILKSFSQALSLRIVQYGAHYSMHTNLKICEYIHMFWVKTPNTPQLIWVMSISTRLQC